MKKYYLLTNKSFDAEGVKTAEELWNKVKGEFDALCMKAQTVFEKASESGKYHATFSTATEDRHGEIVYQKFDLRGFKENPVYLDSHNYSSIEHIIGRVEGAKVKDDKLQGDIIFALDNPKGLLAMKLVEGGFLNTSSIGFIPKEFDEKGNILNSELLEISAVSVPANAEALLDKVVKEIGADMADDEEEDEETDEPTETEKPEEETPANEEVEENKEGEEAKPEGDESAGEEGEPATPVAPKKLSASNLTLVAVRGLIKDQHKSVKRAIQIVGSMSHNEKKKRQSLAILRNILKQDISD